MAVEGNRFHRPAPADVRRASRRVESEAAEPGQVVFGGRERSDCSSLPASRAGRCRWCKAGAGSVRPWWDGADKGSGSVLGIVLVSLAAMGLVLVAMVGNLLICRGRAQTAADAAALSAATALYEGRDSPCVRAASVAAANKGTLTTCTVEEEDVLVDVGVDTSVLIVPRVVQSSRAGPVDCG